MKELSVLSPGGSIGYGVNSASLARAMSIGVDVIAADSGSTDIGPYYLGVGQPYHSRRTMKSDMTHLLRAARAARVPLLIGTAGSAGGNPHLEWAAEILREIAREDDLHFRLATIPAEQPKEYLAERLTAGAVTPMTGSPELTVERIEACTRIVAQMGVEPFITALDGGADVVLAGRACDSAVFAAFAVRSGFDLGRALHMGKILECGALSAVPPTGRDCLLGILRTDEFEVVAPNPERHVTPHSVFAHMVYEVENPYSQGEPGGYLDFTGVSMLETARGTTIVRGTQFDPLPATLRFEGAALQGYRSFLVGGVRDPYLIARIDEFTSDCTEQTRAHAPGTDFEVSWVVYGRDGVLGNLEPEVGQRNSLHEVGLVAQVLAPTQEAAHDIASLLEARMIGYTHPGTKTRTANVAFPLSPMIHDSGQVFDFAVLHIAQLHSESELTSLFPIEFEET